MGATPLRLQGTFSKLPPNCPYLLIEVNINSKSDPAAPGPAMEDAAKKKH